MMVYGKSGEVFKGTTGGDAEDSDQTTLKKMVRKKQLKKMENLPPNRSLKSKTTGDGGGVYSDTTLGDVTRN